MFRRMLAVTMVAGVIAGTRPAWGGEHDNTAVAINSNDGATKWDISFAIVREKGDVVDNANAAVAYSSCIDCRTIAIAIQAIIIESDPSVVSPINLAIAINEGCESCETLASAYQYVFTTGAKFIISAEGRRRIAEIRRALQELRKQEGLTLEEIVAAVDALADELLAVLREEVELAKEPSSDGDGDAQDAQDVQDEGTEPVQDDPTGVEETDAAPVSPSPDEPSPSPSPSASPEPSPSPSPTAVP